MPYYEQPGVMLSDLSHTRREKESDGTGEVDHEYEILDKYSQAYDDVKSPDKSPTMKDKQSPSQSGGDFELIQCPAYIPVGTAGIQSSESKSWIIIIIKTFP